MIQPNFDENITSKLHLLLIGNENQIMNSIERIADIKQLDQSIDFDSTGQSINNKLKTIIIELNCICIFTVNFQSSATLIICPV